MPRLSSSSAPISCSSVPTRTVAAAAAVSSGAEVTRIASAEIAAPAARARRAEEPEACRNHTMRTIGRIATASAPVTARAPRREISAGRRSVSSPRAESCTASPRQAAKGPSSSPTSIIAERRMRSSVDPGTRYSSTRQRADPPTGSRRAGSRQLPPEAAAEAVVHLGCVLVAAQAAGDDGAGDQRGDGEDAEHQEGHGDVVAQGEFGDQVHRSASDVGAQRGQRSTQASRDRSRWVGAPSTTRIGTPQSCWCIWQAGNSTAGSASQEAARAFTCRTPSE